MTKVFADVDVKKFFKKTFKEHESLFNRLANKQEATKDE